MEKNVPKTNYICKKCPKEEPEEEEVVEVVEIVPEPDEKTKGSKDVAANFFASNITYNETDIAVSFFVPMYANRLRGGIITVFSLILLA